MKKIMIPLVLLVIGTTSNAQSDKKQLPPPPPKPKEETVKFTPPKIVKDEAKNPKVVDEKIKLKKPPPPPPKTKEAMVKFTPPKIVKDEEVKVEPVITIKGKMADEFYKRNPSVADLSRQGSIIMLKMKDGTVEKYDTSNKEEDKKFTEKYGESPIPPPPPPPPKKLS